jgi:hypothetical protein
MKIYSLSTITILLFITNCPSIERKGVAEYIPQDNVTSDQLSDSMPFDSVEAKYDTLIPIFDGLFITYNVMDSSYFTYFNKKNEDISIESLVFSGM